MLKVNGILIGNELFPNGETIFKTKRMNPLEDIGNYFVFELKYESDADIAKLIIVKNYITENFIDADCILHMNYIPYSRMDRKIEGFIFSLKYFCKIINELNFAEVVVLDPHSYVSTALLDRVKEFSIIPLVNLVLQYETIDYIFYPDNGAYKRYGEVLKFDTQKRTFYGSKKRDLQTGKITGYNLVDAPDLIGKNILIVDDLCAKGFTFMKAGEALKLAGAKRVVLYVTHCEETIYRGELLTTNVIDHIYTTNSILQNFNEKITKMEID